MKKLFFLLLTMIPMILFGQQDTTQVAPVIPVPDDIIDILGDLNGWFGSTLAVAGLTIFCTVAIAKVWKDITALWKQVVALVVALLLMTVGNIANIGFMANFNLVSTLVYGLMVGFMANGWWDGYKNIKK